MSPAAATVATPLDRLELEQDATVAAPVHRQEVEQDATVAAPVHRQEAFAALGYADASGIPCEVGLIKNRYVGRTFIQPDPSSRDFGVRVKLNPIRDVIAGRRIVLVDDSIVRGTTSRQIVRMLRHTGARAVHVRISSPPILNACYYGIDTSSRGELVASRLSIEEIRTSSEADTLETLKRMITAAPSERPA